jgi:hypothetical protein
LERRTGRAGREGGQGERGCPGGDGGSGRWGVLGRWVEGKGEGRYQVPPIKGRRSKTRMAEKACSLKRALVAMAPTGPAPITATRWALGNMVV